MRYLLALSIGIFSVAWWPRLPDSTDIIGFSVASAIALLVSAIFLTGRKRSFACIIGCVGLGICWALFMADRQLHQQLPEHLDKQDFLITGTIDSLIDTNDRRSRFSFAVDSAQLLSDPSQQVPLKSVLLSWYRFSGAGVSGELRSGERWQIIGRLQRPRGMRNPGAFDYQSWLVQQGYSATGYVRQSKKALRLEGSRHSINNYRNQIREAINGSGLSELGGAVVVALSIGDKQQISAQWDDLARLGIVHLLVISGLHIGLVATMGFWLGAGLGRLLLPLHRRLPVLVSLIGRCSGPLMAIFAALGYSLLAGFSLSTQRALIAVVVVMLSKLLFRRIEPYICMAWALVLIGIAQPLAIMSAGFWLSFVAVGLLLWWFTPWLSKHDMTSTKHSFSLWRISSAQLALLAGMAIPLLFFMGRASWLAPLVNLVAVPWISFVTIPLSLMGVALHTAWPEGASLLWQWADYSVAPLWLFVDWLPVSVGFVHAPMAFDIWGFTAALLAVIGLLLPRGLLPNVLAGRWLLLLPLLAVLICSKPQSPLRLTVLDVGQGLALVLETPDKTLVYDSGPNYGERFSAGSGIVAPYLWRRGRSQIDLLVVSHEDGDHAGGVDSLLASVEVKDVLVGPGFVAKNYRRCVAGQRWEWGEGVDRVSFEILSPSPSSANEGNNSSCVLLIRWRDQTILLPGDIEHSVEAHLQRSPFSKLPLTPVTVMLAPHHGSQTSSTQGFVDRVRPAHVVFSSGYRHQFGHPHSAVVDRYRSVKSQRWLTSEQGAISFVWNQQGVLKVGPTRTSRPDRWWR
ncbi:DNA internalization-related competence protein ComEC/Rec2 [Porticoccaceae bacterium]|nr:DNA internalization-related competence protein ComEC/Rec2 [Porticoccaceae bacterium]